MINFISILLCIHFFLRVHTTVPHWGKKIIKNHINDRNIYFFIKQKKSYRVKNINEPLKESVPILFFNFQLILLFVTLIKINLLFTELHTMYKKKAHIHFVGIGGIGMSGIATILKYQGYHISGCDVDHEQKSVEDLVALGCSIYRGNNTIQCNDASIDILVYSSAIQAQNPEIKAAQERGIPTIARATMLAELMRTKYSIAIAGAHGKTTTTSMISHILIEAHKDPTVIIGGILKNISTHARLGKGDFLVAEADESDRSFLRLYPTLAVVTNIDLEHLDMYKDIHDIKQTFMQFLGNLPFYGKAIVCSDDEHIRSLLPLFNTKTVKYGTTQDADLYAKDIILGPNYSTCTVWKKNHSAPLGSLYLTMPGKHNILNALAATAICLDLDVEFVTIAAALAQFNGVDRRFTFRGTYKKTAIFDDYGHHPTEIYNTLLVARNRTPNKLIVAFQPHRYSRTKGLWDDFINVFAQSNIDQLIITDIYPASEAPLEGITSQRFVADLQAKAPHVNVRYIPYDPKFITLKEQIEPHMDAENLLLLLGAGKIHTLTQFIKISNN